MSIKTYQVLDQTEGKSIHDYDIIVDETDRRNTIYTLMVSSGGHWSDNVRGKKVISITDTGNGYIFPKLNKDVDYSLGMEIFLLLSFMNHGHPMCKYDIVESKKIMSI